MISAKNYFRNLTIIHTSLLLLQILLLATTIGFLYLERDDDYDLEYISADIIFMIICFTLSYFIPRKRFKLARKKLGLREKMTIYKKAMLTRWIFITILSLFSIAAFVMTKEYIFVCSTIFSIAIFCMNRSSIDKACDHLHLSEEDESILNNPGSVI